jgi:uracil-DNA glycosylase
MNWDKFETFFHESWHSKMRPFIESEECDKIYDHLKKEAKRGKKIAPISSNVFRCFQETPLTNLKVIMMGMCPYHTQRNGVPVADGLLMGCSTTGVLQPSLQNFYNGVEKELYNGLNLNAAKSPDVLYLAHQGVLMLNAGLTTEINVAGSHIAIWEPFIKYFFEHVVPYEGVPIVFLGKDASRYEKYKPSLSTSFTLSHPASAAYKQTEWDTEGVFSKVNKLLKDNNNFEIRWLDDILPF